MKKKFEGKPAPQKATANVSIVQNNNSNMCPKKALFPCYPLHSMISFLGILRESPGSAETDR